MHVCRLAIQNCGTNLNVLFSHVSNLWVDLAPRTPTCGTSDQLENHPKWRGVRRPTRYQSQAFLRSAPRSGGEVNRPRSTDRDRVETGELCGPRRRAGGDAGLRATGEVRGVSSSHLESGSIRFDAGRPRRV